MYGVTMRRIMKQERAGETLQRAGEEFFPKLRQAPGFVSFTLIRGEDGVNEAVILFETKEAFEAFQPQAEAWMTTLDSFGHRLEMRTAGEVVQQITPGA